MVFGNKLLASVLRAEAGAAERERYIALGFIKPGKLTAKELSNRGYYAASAAVSARANASNLATAKRQDYRYYGRG